MKSIRKYPKNYIKSATDNAEDFEIDKKKGVLVKYHGNAANVVVPNSVTSIGYKAFRGCTSLTNITIPDSVMSIGYGAFSGCTGLTSITISNSVTSIGNGAFSGCESLTSITIPDSVREIGDYAFRGCTSLTKISLPDNIKLGNNVFKSTPLESKFNQDEDEVVEPEYESDDEFDDEYDEFDQEAAEEEFVENLEDLVRQNYDVIDYFEEPSIQGGVGSDVITMTLNDGKSYEFWFDFEDEVDTIMTDGPESAARQYFAKIQDGIDSGEALVKD